MSDTGTPPYRPLVKICGLTDPDNAAACVRAGADIIGLVFYPQSPRNVSRSLAKKITDRLPAHVPAWGVFVDESMEYILETVKTCGLQGVQLHGQESPEMVTLLKQQALTVTKAVFASRTPGLDTIETRYPQANFHLVECGIGKLPGGNAKTWNYRQIREPAHQRPVILAGGLCCENIEHALREAAPAGIDVSSGVEYSPGIKDIHKVSELIGRIDSYAKRIETKRPVR